MHLGHIRSIVKSLVRLWGFGPLADDAALCVHELLVNVSNHTGSSNYTLTLERRLDRLRVTVSDTSRKLPVAREPDWVTESGRGLVLLDQMTDAWGTDPNPHGKDVWFEMHATPHREAA